MLLLLMNVGADRIAVVFGWIAVVVADGVGAADVFIM